MWSHVYSETIFLNVATFFELAAIPIEPPLNSRQKFVGNANVSERVSIVQL